MPPRTLTFSNGTPESSSLRCFSKLSEASWLRSLQACYTDAPLVWQTCSGRGLGSKAADLRCRCPWPPAMRGKQVFLAMTQHPGLQAPSRIVEDPQLNAGRGSDATATCRLTLSQAPSDFRRSGSLKKSCSTSLFFSVTMSTCPCIGNADDQLIMRCPFASDQDNAKEAQYL